MFIIADKSNPVNLDINSHATSTIAYKSNPQAKKPGRYTSYNNNASNVNVIRQVLMDPVSFDKKLPPIKGASTTLPRL
jgi:hypothetical protein